MNLKCQKNLNSLVNKWHLELIKSNRLINIKKDSQDSLSSLESLLRPPCPLSPLITLNIGFRCSCQHRGKPENSVMESLNLISGKTLKKSKRRK
jgi:hypothetical protein